MDIELLKETIERMIERNHREFMSLAESHGMAFAASAMTTTLAQTLGLVLSMNKDDDCRKVSLIAFSAVVNEALSEYRASIEMLQAIDKVKQ